MTVDRASDAAQGSVDALPLTPAQRGMWFAENLSPDYSVNVAQYLDIRFEPGSFDHELFGECTLAAGRVLQSPYVRLVDLDDGSPGQVVDPDLPITVDIIDFRGEDDPEAAAIDWMCEEYRRPLDIRSDALVLSRLLRIADDRTFWYGRGHHIVIDGYAALTMVRMTVDRYNAARSGAEVDEKPAATLAEIVADEQKYAQSTRRESDGEHWREVMADLPERVTLSRHPSATGLSPNNIVASAALPPQVQARVEEVASELGSSMAMVMAAAYGAFLYRMTGNDDVLISLPVTGRATAKIKRAGGMASNILPVRMAGLSGETVAELVRSVQIEMTGALRHQRYRSDDIRRDAGLDPDAVGFGPTLNMVFFDAPIEIDGATVEYRILASGTLEDLLVNLYQSSPTAPLVVDLHGNPFRYTEAEMESHHRRFMAFIEGFVSDPGAPVWALPLLLPGEEALLAQAEQGLVRDYGIETEHILDRFVAQVSSTPDAIAVCDGDQHYTYAQFDAIRSALVRSLRSSGVGLGDRVAIVLDRGVAQVAAVYAVESLGAAYVPLDPADPAGRRELVLGAAKPAVVVDADFLDREGFAPDQVADGPSEPLIGTGAPSYVYFTSGSTGVPKGVELGMAAVVNRLAWMREEYPITSEDAWLYKTPITFDCSVSELFGPLQVGARMVIARPGGHREPDYLRDLMERENVTIVHFVPSMLDVFLETVGPSFPESVRRVQATGEALPGALTNEVRSGREIEVLNTYGPTEAAVEITAYSVEGEIVGGVPIGRPTPNSETLVLDAHFQRLPVGAVGELYLGGCQLAHGYAGQPGLTAERFVANPFVPGERMYRTGDLARWREDGNLEYLGRIDFQVKIRGQRVELGEVEAALLADEAVEAAVAVVRDLPAGTSVVAYVRVASDDPDLVDRLLRRSAEMLPSHMVPAAITVLDEFPTNSAGKMDRAALPEPTVAERPAAKYIAPVSVVQTRIAEEIRDLLGLERVGLGDNLFALGADSLAAARLATKLRVEHDLNIPLTAMFNCTDVAGLAEAAEVGGNTSRPELVARDRPDSVPVSAAQMRLWFINRLDPASPTYNMAGAVRLGAQVDVEALGRAVADVVVRHESLRTRFVEVGGEPTQVVDPVESVESVVSVVDTDDVEGEMARVAAQGFDLSAGAFRAVLVRGTQNSVLVVVLHHIVGDGASLRPLIGDVLTAYNARRYGFGPFFPPLPVQYADYSLWYDRVLGDAADEDSVAAREIGFWAKQLSGAPEVISLPTDRPRPARPTGGGDFVDRVLSESAVATLRSLAAQSGVTLFSVVQAALVLVLARLNDTDDVVIGTAVAGRDEPQVADLIGMFVNTVALRTDVSPGLTVEELLARVHRGRAEALANATTPFEQVVDAVAPSRTLAHSPVFQVALTMVTDAMGIIDGDLGFEVVDSRVPAAKNDLTLTVTDYLDSGRLGLEFNYATDLFDESSVESFADYVERVLVAMAAGARSPIGRIDLLSDDEVDRAVAPAARLAEARPLRAFVGEWLATGCRRDEQALLAGAGVRLSATAASSRINQLARELLARGAGPGSVVAVRIPRSVDSVVAMFAAAVAGAAFVFVDPKHPAARQEELLADSAAVLGVTTTTVDAPPAGDVDWIVLQDETTELHLAGHPTTAVAERDLPRPVHLDDTAYLIYTSGSTGKPKAVEVPHRGIANLASNLHSVLGAQADSAVLHVASPAFDATMHELMTAIGSGARVVVAQPDAYAGPALAATIAEGGVTHAAMTPSVLATIDPAQVPSLESVCSGGEACPEDLVARWARACEFFNVYGPTEVTVWASADGPMTAGQPVTIGAPLPGVTGLVLDAGLRPVPLGVVGDLYLGGDQVARGYRHRADLTAGAFVADPFGTGGRLYRTGDRVVRRADGRLVYQGRSDFQLKINGLRIEPGEIDAVLASHPSVATALSMGVERPGGDTVLAAYVSPRVDEVIAPDALLAYARERLPAHMVPHTVRVLPEFPRTAIGKIDRAALPPIEFAEAEFVAPRTELEATVAGVVASVLDLDHVSVTSGFFEVGGNSLSAAKLAARLGEVLDRPVGVEAVFEAPTPAELAALLAQQDGSAAVAPLVARPRAAVVPVSSVQRGMWLLNRAAPESSAYNVALTLRLTGQLDADALRAALVDVIDRHESLRTMYPMINGVPVQVIESTEAVAPQVDVPVTDLTGCDEAQVAAAVAAVTDEGFDVTSAVPIRAALLRLGPEEHIISLVVHHISVDGASMMPLAKDLMIAYDARSGGGSPRWEPLSVQFADYAVWSAERLATEDDGVTERDRQLAYWADRLDGAPELLRLPTDRPRPTAPTYAAGEVESEIPAELVARLTETARSVNATLFMIAHAALAVLLAKVSGRTDIVIGSPYAGRGAQALDDVVGMFVNTVAFRTELDPAMPFNEFVGAVRRSDLADLAHADVAFEEVVTALGRGNTAGYNPLFQVLFAFQNLTFPTVELGGLALAPEPVPTATVKNDITLTLFPNDPLSGRSDGAMRATWAYATELFDEATITRLAGWYLGILETIAADPTTPLADIALEKAVQPVPDAAGEVAPLPLPEAVAVAAQAAPEHVAVELDGTAISLGELAATTAAMAAVLPDSDGGSALTTALFTALPALAAGGPESLDDALTQLRVNADKARNVYGSPDENPAEALRPQSAKGTPNQ